MTQGGERPMGTTTYGGKRLKGTTANGDRPIEQYTKAACQPPPPRLGGGCPQDQSLITDLGNKMQKTTARWAMHTKSGHIFHTLSQATNTQSCGTADP